MAVVHDYYCPKCDAEYPDQWSDNVPRCCGAETRVLMPCLRMFEWGGPRTYIHLRDEPFSSRSELNSWAKANGMSLGESSEKVGGARNDMYDGVGKFHSIPGVSRRTSSLSSVSMKDYE